VASWPVSAFERLLVAVLVGFLIGLDRERTEARKARRLFAGVRTFPLIALAGAVPTLILDRVGPALLVVSFVAVAAIAVVSYVRSSAAGDVGATTEIAAMATFLLGVLAGAGEIIVAGAAGVGVAVLLVAKPRLEGFSRTLSDAEIAAALELAVISVIVLPLLPNRGYGPWEVLNPFEIWLVVVLVSGVSFAGFVAMRLLGERRGITVAGLVGAMVSSTAVTVAMATQSRTQPNLARASAGAAVLASTIMGLRVLILCGAVNVGIVPRLIPIVVAMGAVGGIAAWMLVRLPTAGDAARTEARISNPFSLPAALTFGGIYALVVLGVRAAEEFFGARGMFVAAALSALADVDAVSIAFARLGSGASGWRDPAAAVSLALVVNTLVKLAIATVMGGRRFRAYVAIALGVMAALGAATGIMVARG
jgi:uncharacterized membrane protein (DUF4010 family)